MPTLSIMWVPRLVQGVSLLVGLAGVLLVLVRGARLFRGRNRARFEDRWAGIGIAVLWFVDVPLLHTGRCSTPPSVLSAERLGIWWLPYAAYSTAVALCMVRLALHRSPGVPWRGLGFAWLVALLLAVGVELGGVLPWWAAHLAFQTAVALLLVLFGGRAVFGPRALLLAWSCLLPMLPVGFWHAAVRVRRGDTVEEAAQRMASFWLVRESAEGGQEIHMSVVDASELAESAPEELWFSATGRGHADFLGLHLSDGRVQWMEYHVD